MNELFNKPKFVEVIICVYNNRKKKMNVSKISHSLNTTYCNVFAYLKNPNFGKLFISEKIGRERIVKLSKKGIEIAKRLSEVEEIMKNWDASNQHQYSRNSNYLNISNISPPKPEGMGIRNEEFI